MATGDNDDTECNLFAPDHEEEEESEGNSGKNVDVNDVNSKTSLISPDTAAFEKLVAKIRDLVEDNHGEAIYTVGVGEINETPGLNEEDLKASIATLQGICDQLNCDCNTLREKSIEGGKTVEFLLREKIEEEDFSEVRVAVVGNVDAGKSTLLGVLTHGLLDDGRGTARLKLFRHKHEAETGRTSSVGNDILGFDSKGDVVNKPDPHSGSLDWTQICRESSKVLTFIDLAGHEKYLKTTVFGMTGHAPDFCMLMIGSNAGIVGMTKEHLGLALALNVPVFIVVTKIDMCPPNILQETLKLLTRILKSPGCRKIPVFVSNNDDVIVSATNFTSERICPIFQVSNVTGLNLDLLKSFLNLLSTRGNYERKKPAIFQIDDTYSVPGVGTVISGTTLQGVIRINDVMLLGPDGVGVFQSVPIKSVHRKRLPVKEVRAGQSASFAMKKIKRQDIRKGMVLVSPELEPTATWEFDADVLVLHHPTTISQKYQAMVHCGSLRQTATIVRMDKEHLRTGDKADCRFRFMKGPEYIQKGSKMIFREGRTKAVGTITKLYDNVVGKASHNTRVSKQHKAMMHSSAAARRGSGPRQPFSNTTAATASGATPTEKQTMSVM